MSETPIPAPRSPAFTRRTAVKLVAAAVGGAGVGAGGSALLTRLGDPTPPQYRFFTDAEAALAIAVCEQIIPRDDAPGATDAGVIHYLDRQLATRLARHRKTYRAGLQAWNETCRAMHQKPFGELSPAEQIAFMRQVEAGKVPAEAWQGVQPAAFFNLLVDHTMQGFYGSPKHGGNRDYLSYKILGVDYPQVIGRNRHRRT
jgi:gluconate 2-dehydrogenase gamma chain